MVSSDGCTIRSADVVPLWRRLPKTGSCCVNVVLVLRKKICDQGKREQSKGNELFTEAEQELRDAHKDDLRESYRTTIETGISNNQHADNHN